MMIFLTFEFDIFFLNFNCATFKKMYNEVLLITYDNTERVNGPRIQLSFSILRFPLTHNDYTKKGLF